MKPLTDEQRHMVENNVNLVYKCLNSAGYVSSRSDAEQELMLELCAAARNYDSSKGKFSTYAVACIKHRIKELKAKGDLWGATRQFKKGEQMYVGFKVTSLNRKMEGNDEELEQIDIIPSTEISVEDAVLSNLTFGQFMAQLSDKDRRILEMRLEGYTYQEIADYIGISEAHACRRVKQLVKKLNS